jgi:hypothetical protein
LIRRQKKNYQLMSRNLLGVVIALGAFLLFLTALVVLERLLLG